MCSLARTLSSCCCRSFAHRTVDMHKFKVDTPPSSSGLCIELDTARLTLLAPDRVLISLKDGAVRSQLRAGV